MSLYDHERRQRVCLIPIPSLPHLTEKKREAGVYISGGLFAIGWWFFIDAVVYSNYCKSKGENVPIMNFEEWMCGILSTLGMIIINLINKSHLTTYGSYGYDGNMYARLFLFVGFAALAGGLAGSFTILILKYIVNETPHTYFGVALIIQNLSIMFSTFILWIAQSSDDEGGYPHYL
uniref:Vacuolar protein sorting-associated protein 68 n=1 Tax=Anthurium amnicola TaxID=1678845 RepID=A0A1D1XQZ2_9ARAE